MPQAAAQRYPSPVVPQAGYDCPPVANTTFSASMRPLRRNQLKAGMSVRTKIRASGLGRRPACSRFVVSTAHQRGPRRRTPDRWRETPCRRARPWSARLRPRTVRRPVAVPRAARAECRKRPVGPKASTMPRASVAWVRLQRVPPERRIFTPGSRFLSSRMVLRPRWAARAAGHQSRRPAADDCHVPRRFDSFNDSLANGTFKRFATLSATTRRRPALLVAVQRAAVAHQLDEMPRGIQRRQPIGGLAAELFRAGRDSGRRSAGQAASPPTDSSAHRRMSLAASAWRANRAAVSAGTTAFSGP